MDLSFLDQQIQNNIIMYQRPRYKYLKEIRFLSDWYEGDDEFHVENKFRWIFDAIRIRREVQRDFNITEYYGVDISEIMDDSSIVEGFI